MQEEVHKDVDKREQEILAKPEGALLVVPESVIDVESYKKYRALKDSKALLLPERLIETSDIHTVIDPMAHYVANTKKIAHLPSDEQDNIIKRMKSIKVLYLRIGALKKSAFGLKRRKHHPSLLMGLLDERGGELIEYFGQMLTDEEVHKIVNKEWGYEASLHSIKKFRLGNKELIDQAKDKFVKDFSSLRLSHKRGRLEELQKIFIARKLKWETTKNREDEKMLVGILREIRNETEDKTLRIDANINANINVSIQHHIEKEVMNGLTINDIILARAASRMQVNPGFLISRLHNSIYAKFSGFAPKDEGVVEYPSAMVYNWKEIKKQHDEVGDSDTELTEWEDVTDEKKTEALDIKDVLLAKLRQKKDDVSIAKDRVQQAKKNQ